MNQNQSLKKNQLKRLLNISLTIMILSCSQQPTQMEQNINNIFSLKSDTVDILNKSSNLDSILSRIK